MTLYHYRSIRSALLEIKNISFHFAARDELNDPIEGYVHVVWRGDKAAWEGLFRNYICSVYHAIRKYLRQADEETLRHKSVIQDFRPYDSLPLSQEFSALGLSFLKDATVQKFTSFYGDHTLLVQEDELKFILHYLHSKALTLCIQSLKEKGIMPIQEANVLLDIFSSETRAPFPYDAVAYNLSDEATRSLIMKKAEGCLEEMVEKRYASLGWNNVSFLYGYQPKDKKGASCRSAEAHQRRDWMTITVDYPGVYGQPYVRQCEIFSVNGGLL